MKKRKLITYLLIIICSASFGEVFANNYTGNHTDYLLCLQDDQDWYYSGSLHIPVSANLKTEEESITEAEFAADIQSHLDKSEENYKRLPESLNGKIISTDLACHLYQPLAVLSDAKDKAQYFFSTRIPAAWFMNYLYHKRLVEIIALKKETNDPEKREVVFLAGGDGSGKTSALRHLNLPIIEKADIIKDATMSGNIEHHKSIIEKTLASGFKVTLIYVFRPIELALKANILRAEEIGRMRPLAEIVDAHYSAQQNVLELSHFFGDRVDLIVIDNSKTFAEISVVEDGIAFINDPLIKYENYAVVLECALNTYHTMNKEAIPEFVINLLEHSNTSQIKTHNESEKLFWITYLQGLIANIAQKLGIKA